MEEMVITGGKNRNIKVKITIEEIERERYGKKYKNYEIFTEVNKVKETIKLTEFPKPNQPTTYTIEFYNTEDNMFGRKGHIHITISEEDYKKLENLEKEIENKNKEIYKQFLESIPLRFVVRKENLRLLDMYYEAKVFIPNRELTEEEEEKYEKLKKAVEKFAETGKWHLDGYIDAREYEEGQEFTLEQLEQMFKKEIEAHENRIREIQEEKKRKQEEYERKKRKALEEAKKTGKEIVIRKVGMFDGDDPSNSDLLWDCGLGGYNEGSDYGLVIVYEVATPKGEIIEKGFPSY